MLKFEVVQFHRASARRPEPHGNSSLGLFVLYRSRSLERLIGKHAAPAPTPLRCGSISL
jgi:hypothetical protein